MKNIDKKCNVPKWVLINWPKIPQMPQNLFAQIVCPNPKVWDFDEKRLHWASVVRVYKVLKIVRCKNAGAENSSRKTMIAESTRQFSRPTM